MPHRGPEDERRAWRLISSKLGRPELPAGYIVRPHLLEQLDQAGAARVTLISAPAGYGKSTLVAQWLECGSSPAAGWLSLDRLDNDLERFTRYVIAALRRVEEGCLPQTEEMLSTRNLPPPEVLAESMVVEIKNLARRAVLVLDDYGLIREDAVHRLVSSLVLNLPPTLRLVVSSRIDPPLPLSLWRSRRWLNELRAIDLRWSRDEARAFFAAADEVELSDEGVDTIHQRTEGWITGLRLALLSLTGEADPEGRVRAFSASDRLVGDYLVEEVLARQPAEVREFLAFTSVLERFSPELCDELLAGSGRGPVGRSREILDRLHRKNLFLVALGPTDGWYRYHHLFQELMADRIDELPSIASRQDILTRAGDWFCHKGWTEDGLRCYLAAGDLDAAEDVIGSQLHTVIATDLSRRTLTRWLEMFPPGAENGRLTLLVAMSYLRSLNSDPEGVDGLLEVIDSTCGGAESERRRKWWIEFQADLDYFRAFACFWKGDVEGTVEHGLRVFDRLSDPGELVVAFTMIYYGISLALTGRDAEYHRLIDRGTAGRDAADRPEQLPFFAVKASVHLFRGELAQLQTASSNLTTSTTLSIPKYFEAFGYLLRGLEAYERNQLDEAERHFLAAESRRFDGTAFTYQSATIGLGLIALARGNLDAAERHVGSSRAFAIEIQNSMVYRDSVAVERYLAIAAGKPVDLAIPPPSEPDFTHSSILPPSHSWAWALLHSPSRERRQAALDFIDVALERAETHEVTRRAIPLSALRALALDALDRRDEAIPVLVAALQRGADLGFVRSFVDWGERIRPLIQTIAAMNPDDEYVAMLLDALAGSASSSARAVNAGSRSVAGRGNPALVDDLTDRELDVLELLQRRMTNKEIAAWLGISAATVKMHTLGIYRKLEVRGRRQAVAAATELGILGG